MSETASSSLPVVSPKTESLAASRRRRVQLALGALGVVYGDVGTSPLYALRECFSATHGVPVTAANVLGVLSLVIWSLTLIVSVKYLLYVLRADNKGEGGILALSALASTSRRDTRVYPVLIGLGVLGASLLTGEGIITPAISVLSAVEGIEVAAPRTADWVIPITIAILVALFLFQRRGTAKVGSVFGPITLAWFCALALLGGHQLVHDPSVLAAVNPLYAVEFLVNNGKIGLVVLGSVFLVVTGAEALYADLGHFGRQPIRFAWFAVVLPGLLLNYLGQGAFLLANPAARENPFYRLVPQWGLYPMIVLSTAATIIASQALISGVYSLSRQAIMLGLLPRLTIRHTSADERGQVYVGTANWFLMIATISLVLGFGSSSRLAAAYGIAATLTMMTTTLLAFFVTRFVWGWPLARSLLVTAVFLVPEFMFAAANVTKVGHGGWFPLVVGAGLFAVMLTWKRGRQVLAERFRERLLPLVDFLELIRVEIPARVPGTAVFMTSSLEGTPPALLQNFLHNRVLHQRIVLLTIITTDAAHVLDAGRAVLEKLEAGFSRLTAHYGFMEQPDAPKLLLDAGVATSLEHVTFFLGRENLIATERPGMAKWRVHLFAFLTRNAQSVTKFFNIPPDRVVELGAQIEL
ncbi:MAG: potassium transporter Kup [Polyangiaceae bacterium]|nr:potassium transporter Kup [Polyangiaceae bacterium]